MPDLFYILTTLAVGLFAGALLTEACLLLPYWRRMEPSEFFRLHKTIGPNLFRYFAPLTVIAVLLSAASAVISFASNASNMWHMASAALCLTALSVFLIYFKNANAKFSGRTISDSQLSAELSRWAAWHWFRTVLVIIAFAASIIAHV